ncbi:MAG: hypothetical protein ACP6IQ_10295 [Candidatus Njordarchaeia archaeon]|nr:hypothetical protein [Candidatus Korarchaeota archaeon]
MFKRSDKEFLMDMLIACEKIMRYTKVLIERILLPAIGNIKFLGGQKSRGAGKVNIQVDF